MKETKKTAIGGQAVIEGIAMRGQKVTVLACRLPDGQITTERFWNRQVNRFFKWPLVRGLFNMIVMMIDGFKYLNLSMEKSGFFDEDEENEENKKAEKTGETSKNKGNKATQTLVSVVSAVFGVALSFGIFMWFPQFLTKMLALKSGNGAKSVIEGCIKIFILVAYMWIMSFLKEMKRLFEYHGAEHKTIACYEKGLELVPANVRKCTRFHPRCGTSFILVTVIVSILVSAPLRWENLILRMITKVFLIPFVVGISYEVIKLVGRHDGVLSRIVSAPGLWLQRITTSEPDDKQIEVAIEALKGVLAHTDSSKDKW
ncbi:membrane protein [Clostridia bacterium]|nr:membrane protein [Clostridia bacterium]